ASVEASAPQASRCSLERIEHMKGRVMTGPLPLTARQSWKALQVHRNEIGDLRALFAADATRGERLTAEAVGIHLDYSKNRITDETVRLLGRAGRRVRAPRADRRDVPRRQDQRDRKPRRPARGPEGAARHVDRRRR